MLNVFRCRLSVLGLVLTLLGFGAALWPAGNLLTRPLALLRRRHAMP